MSIRKFKCIVRREDEYIIEIDDEIINDEFNKEFSKHFYPFDELEDHAEHLSQIQARFDNSDGFIEGYGYIKRDGELPFSFKDFDKNGKWLPQKKQRQPTDGINIIIEDEDNYCEVDVEEIVDISQLNCVIKDLNGEN